MLGVKLFYSSVGITASYGLDGKGIEHRWGVRGGGGFPASVQTGHGVHPASYTMGTGHSRGRGGGGLTTPPI